MENCKEKMCLIVKNCCGCKTSFQSICRSLVLIYNVEKKEASAYALETCHMQKLGIDLQRGEKGSDRENIEMNKLKKKTIEKEIDLLENELKNKKSELAILSEEVSGEFKIPVKREKKSVEVPTGKRNLLGIEQKKTVMK